jgi:hypothetical protein
LLRLIGASYLGFDLAMIALSLLIAAYVIWKILDAQAFVPDLPGLRLTGKAESPEDQPAVSEILQRISKPLHCPVPDTVIYVLEPSIQCTRRPVDLNGAEVRGLTLVISLPLCRLLSEAELISLISGELTRCELVPPDWEAWMNSTYAKWKITAESDHAAYFNLLWLWMEQWNTWSMVPSLWSAERSAAIAGSQNAAAALAVSALVHGKWESFLSEVQIALRRGTIDPARDQVNLSERFAAKMSGIARDLASSYRSSEQPGTIGLPSMMTLMQADPAEVAHRIATGPKDRASDCLIGLERLEAELSNHQIRHIFFV